MRLGSKGLALIKRFEGYSATVYICPAGFSTIGYGHKLVPGDGYSAASRVNEASAESQLLRDAGVAERAIERLVTVPLQQHQFDALVSFIYNLGVGAFQGSTLRKRINAGDFKAVPDELRRWVYAKGQKMTGLINRREAEAKLWEGKA